MSRIILGTMTWGRETDKREAATCYMMAREAGIDTFDTAAIYGGGKAEQWLGEFTKHDPEVKVNTKVGYNGEDPVAQLEECLSRLGRPVYTVFHHHWMKHGSFDHVDRLDLCRRSGMASRVGLSNCAAWQAALVSREVRIDAVQFLYNLLKRQAEVELIPLAKHQGWEMQGYSPLASGALTGKYAHAIDPTWRLNADRRYARRYAGSTCVPVQTWPMSATVAPSVVALAWASQVSRPIVGARNAKQLDEVLVPPPPEVKRQLWEMSVKFPTPPPATDRSEEHGNA